MKLNHGDIVDGKYRVVRLLGEGGMGAVYEAENQRISRRVAIKVLHASTAAKATAVRRFEQEAQAAGKIGSEHIVEVLDLGQLLTGEKYMVMEFLEGETLEDRIKKMRRLSPHQAAPLVIQLLEGLAAAHRAGIIHRDLKPENVFLVRSLAGKRDFVKVVDFGVSKFSALETEGMSMTSTGAVVGTPYYLSPEQARGVRQLDARSDLYSVGVVLYQSVTGRLPFHAETFNELVFKIALESPEPAEIVVPNLDPAFAAIISKAMVRETNGRFQTAEEFQAALGRWLEEHPDPLADPTARGSGASYPPTRTTGPYGGDPNAAAHGAQRVNAGTVPLSQAGPGPWSPSPQGGGQTPFPGAQPGPMAMTPSAPMAVMPGGLQSSPQLGTSQVGMTVSARPPKKTGTVVAVTAVVVVCMAGGAFGAYKFATGGSAQATPTSAPTASGQAQAAPPTTAAVDPAQAPSATPSSTPSAMASDASTNAPTTQASAPTTPASATAPSGAGTRPSGTSVAVVPPTGSTKKPDSGAAPTATATAGPKPTGRVIGGDL